MINGEPQGQDGLKRQRGFKQGDSVCKILPFRRREVVSDDVARDDHGEGRVARDAGSDIDRLIDLERYERPPMYTEDYRRRMFENVAALAFLSVLIAIAAFDFIDLEQIQHCTSAGGC